MPTLDGLTKYAHLIDVDYFADLLQVSHSFTNLHTLIGLVVIGPVYMAYPGGCRHRYKFLPRLRPYIRSCMHTVISFSRCILCRAAFATVSSSIALVQA